MLRVKFIWIAAVVWCCIVGCRDSFEFSPNQVFDDDSEVGINAKNLEWLQSLPQDDTVTIAFVGDSQRFYDELTDFIDTVNNIPSVDFVLLAGDISDFGLLEEFEIITDIFKDMNKPYFGVIGNHDVVAKGEQVFERMFGPLNYSFNYGGVKFVAHNTNSKEYNNGKVPDLNWLRSQLVRSDSAQFFVPVSHVPPYSDDFDKALEGQYTALFQEAPGLLLSLHAHIHELKDGYPYNDGVRYLATGSFDKRSFVLIKIWSGQVETNVIEY